MELGNDPSNSQFVVAGNKVLKTQVGTTLRRGEIENRKGKRSTLNIA
jgi:hypothetical protein